ncbi:MAG: hypothetical protein DWQ05_12030 [Calditrichaeota bacterium]|nr:MAG: hypothetical protein DWQ05_12030 [Calditrichota bacterium]
MLKENQKFVCIAIDGIDGSAITLPLKMDLFWVMNEPSFVIKDIWKEWLGSLRIEEILNCGVFILIAQDSTNPGILDDESAELLDNALMFYTAIPFTGNYHMSNSCAITGENAANSTVIRQISNPNKYFSNENVSSSVFGKTKLMEALSISKALKAINENSECSRLLRGVNAFLKGLSEVQPAYRIHQFVRALEALLKPPIGQTRNKFIHRCKTFLKCSPDPSNTLGEVYDLRSKIEHMHDWSEAFPDISIKNIEQRAMLRTRQIEHLTRNTYRRILTDSILRENFQNSNIDNFWSQSDSKKMECWGDGIEINAIMDS